MPQFAFGSTKKALKILDAGADGAFIALQVLDASTLFFDRTLDTLNTDGLGLAAPNSTQGFQIKTAQGIVQLWWKGELWARSDTNNGLVQADIIFQLGKKKGGGGCGGGCGCGGGEPAPGALPTEA